MLWLVDLDRAVTEKRLSPADATSLKARARDTAVELAINTLQVGGTLAVLIGLMLWIDGPLSLIATGAVIAALGAGALAALDTRFRLPAEAAGVVGMACVIGGAFWLTVEEVDSTMPAVLFGPAFAVGGVMLFRQGPAQLRRLGAWTAAMGGAAHIAGVFGLEGSPGLEWIAFADAALVLGVLGLLIDIRLLTALAVPALAGIASAHGYGHGSYFLAIWEPTIVAVAMAALAAVLMLKAPDLPERIARHARIAGLIALVWVNLALWVASIWGDRPTASFSRPRFSDHDSDFEAWRGAVEAWEQATIHIPAEVFAILWALILLGVAIWAALTARRSVLNAALTFGAIHFYTQWFEAFEAEPLALIVAGVIAIAAAWGTHRLNRRLIEAQASPPGDSAQ